MDLCQSQINNGSDSTWWEFKESYVAIVGFSLQLQQEQNFSMKQLFKGGDFLAVLPTGFGKSLIF